MPRQNHHAIAEQADVVLGRGLTWLLAGAAVVFSILGVAIGAGALISGHLFVGAVCLLLAVSGIVAAHHLITRRRRLSDYDWNA